MGKGEKRKGRIGREKWEMEGRYLVFFVCFFLSFTLHYCRPVQQISSQWGVWCFLSLQRDATHLDRQSNGRPIYQLEIIT